MSVMGNIDVIQHDGIGTTCHGQVIYSPLNLKEDSPLELYLDYTPDSCLNEEGEMELMTGETLLYLIEICGWSEHEEGLEKSFFKDMEEKCKGFARCTILLYGGRATHGPAPSEDGQEEKRHNFEWQMFERCRVVGVKAK